MGVYYCFTHIRLNMLIFNSPTEKFPEATTQIHLFIIIFTSWWLFHGESNKNPHLFRYFMAIRSFFSIFHGQKKPRNRVATGLPCPTQVAYRVIFSQDTMGVVDRRDLLEVSGEAKLWIGLWHGKALGLWENLEKLNILLTYYVYIYIIYICNLYLYNV